MSSTAVAQEAPRTAPLWLALTAGVLPLIGFVVFLLLPYYANDLDRLSLTEVASGLHDPKDLWPRNAAGLGWVFDAGGALTVFFGAMLAVAGLAMSLHGLAVERHVARPTRTLLWVAAAGSAALMLGLGISPLGRALYVWWMD